VELYLDYSIHLLEVVLNQRLGQLQITLCY